MAGQASFSEAGGCSSDLAPLRHAVHHREQIANLHDLQHGALNARLLQHLAGIDQPGEIETPAGTQVLADLGGELLLTLNPGAVAAGLKRLDPRLPELRLAIAAQELSQAVELENAGAVV